MSEKKHFSTDIHKRLLYCFSAQDGHCSVQNTDLKKKNHCHEFLLFNLKVGEETKGELYEGFSRCKSVYHGHPKTCFIKTFVF